MIARYSLYGVKLSCLITVGVGGAGSDPHTCANFQKDFFLCMKLHHFEVL